MTQRNEPTAPGDLSMPMVTLRTAGELADALPYFMGYHPSDSLVLVALQGDRGQFAGRVRLGIPGQAEDWEFIAQELPRCLVQEVERRAGGERPDAVIAYLCREPGPGESGRQVMESLRPLADSLLATCRDLGLNVLEALCLSGDRYWSYACTEAGEDCCPPEGRPMPRPGTSVIAASATFAGIQVRGTQREMEARLAPLTGPSVASQEEAIDDAVGEALPRLMGGDGEREFAAGTLLVISGMIARLQDGPPPRSAREDEWDDRLLTDAEVARALVGLQDPETRDRATLWMDGLQAAAALRLWRALSRRCVGVYGPYGAAVRTLAGWAAWCVGDPTEARISLEMALAVEPDCGLADVLYRAIGADMPLEAMRAALCSSMAAYAPLHLPTGVWPPVGVLVSEGVLVQGELFGLGEVRELDRAGEADEANGTGGPAEVADGDESGACGRAAAMRRHPSSRRRVPAGRRPKPGPARTVPRQRRGAEDGVTGQGEREPGGRS
ncbi:DUF4192 domain-containing protein [Streptomyces sp. TRM66268-LWL]|uniref:DUF4192 domain-containing protein n=1 Tax=Streptomyces polyasparticus TaxID=2767826 RepID=A0ABR7SU85_9ACTN|nr:DUF4192 domain-containing protein [Streptomyces polyasparticus]MBC9718359.1 DUF4192 domain-containing protein [Streptomyces polyasparticus]